MRYLVLLSVLSGMGGLTATSAGPASAKSPQEKTRELLIGKWEDPERPGNSIKFDRDGRFGSRVSGGAVLAHPAGTYRVLPDGSLEWRVRVDGQAALPRRFLVKVTKDKLVLTNEQHREARFKRVK